MNKTLMLAALAGAAVGLAPQAFGQGRVINISGATLLENFANQSGVASTNDFIDVDGDGIAGKFNSVTIDQLAPTGTGRSSGFPASQWWVVQYRAVGSVNGFVELMRFGGPGFVTTEDNDTNGILGARPRVANPPVSNAYHNRVTYIGGTFGGGNRGTDYTEQNPGGAPNRSLTTAPFTATLSTSAPAGIRIDIAPLDVPTTWAVRNVANPGNWNRKPSQDGYGNNARVSTNSAGTLTGANLPSNLPDLQGGRQLYDGNPANAVAGVTIFDTPLSYAVIVLGANYGTGVSSITQSAIQHLSVTGRMNTGENLVFVTRDVGSGTRNAFYNCIGVDPSWGVGENIGAISNAADQHQLGPTFIPGNKGGNGGIESTVRQHRLALGYIGGERGVTGSAPGSWLTGGANAPIALPDVIFDGYGATQPSRPTIFNITNNLLSGPNANPNAWFIGGPAVLATIGDPGAEPVANGGLGRTTPRMFNSNAADYINNIERSIEAFVAVPNAPENDFMPGELAAVRFTLPNALRGQQGLLDATNVTPNPNFNLAVYNRALSTSVYTNPAFATFNSASGGLVPTRSNLTGGALFSDGNAGTGFVLQDGSTVAEDAGLVATNTLRNRVSGDFNGDGLRTAADATGLVRAFRQRNGGPVWNAPDGIYGSGAGLRASIEILGDFTGDGNFGRRWSGSAFVTDTADARYWADGLVLVSGQLNRNAGFTALDNAWAAEGQGNNFFGTTKSTGAAHNAGDSRADVAGPSGLTTRGYNPIGADGTIDILDVRYVASQFRANPGVGDGAANWNNLSEAAFTDLSCDMTGDLVVDNADLNAVFQILGTCSADFNLDGEATFDDIQAFVALYNSNDILADLNSDGEWTFDDIQIFVTIFNGC